MIYFCLRFPNGPALSLLCKASQARKKQKNSTPAARGVLKAEPSRSLPRALAEDGYPGAERGPSRTTRTRVISSTRTQNVPVQRAGRSGNWPLCCRRVGLPEHVEVLKTMARYPTILQARSLHTALLTEIL
uniref:Uncharacterized protein n=1 Tax=Canis lupus dingo TaxID=286419 RepID=A0A8C0L5D9_CANLU